MPSASILDSSGSGEGPSIRLEGSWFAAGTARQDAATLTVEAGRVQIRTEARLLTFRLADTRLSSVGDPAIVELADGSSFIASAGQRDTDAVRDVLSPRDRTLTRLERNRRSVLVALLATVGLALVFLLLVLPRLSRPIANMVPPAWMRLLDEQTLALFDQRVLETSELPESKQDEITTLLDHLVADLGLDDARYRLLIRSSTGIGANAFALPGGTLVMTDAMVELATEDELSAVLAHEIGHVQHRHGVQQILRTSILAALLVMIGPDAGTISTLASGLPAVLIESGYSREFEREADLYACDALVRTGRDPQGLARALERLAAQSGETSLPAWVSTHPQTQERIEAIRTFGR